MDLEISFLDHEREAKTLNFYDINSIYMEDYELVRAEKWSTAVNNTLKPNLKTAKVA